MTKIKNNSGCKPVIIPEKSKLLVYIGKLGEQKTKGGIILSEKNIHEEAYKRTTGILVDIAHKNKQEEKDCQLKLGDTLCFRPYSGIHKEGNDGCAYRLLEGYEIHSLEI